MILSERSENVLVSLKLENLYFGHKTSKMQTSPDPESPRTLGPTVVQIYMTIVSLGNVCFCLTAVFSQVFVGPRILHGLIFRHLVEQKLGVGIAGQARTKSQIL